LSVAYIVDLLLRRGFAIRSFGRSPQPALEAKGVEVICGDLADAADVRDACEGMDAVFHVAAKAGVWGDWNSFYQPNGV
jgi:nucleoside-diphosphate-sugar epimerase